MTEETKLQITSVEEQERTRTFRTLKQKVEQFLNFESTLAITLLSLVLVSAPWLLSNPEEFDEALCSLREVTLENARNTVISCINPQGETVEITLEFLIYQYDVSTFSEDQIANPPFFSSEYASNLNDPNFNCHSLTLQLIEAATGVELGAGRTAWLEKGLDTFMAEFGQEVTSVSEIPTELTEDVIDTTSVTEGDVVLFFDHTGTLIHSATVAGPAFTEDGERYLQIMNKLGRDGELNSSIDDMVKLYDLAGPYDEGLSAGGGSIIVYRPDWDRIRTSFQEN